MFYFFAVEFCKIMSGGMKMCNQETGERIRFLRELNNYTREAFAEKIEISSKFLYEIETGKKGFSSDILGRISKALYVSSDFILFGESESQLNIDNIICVLNKFDGCQIGRLMEIIQMIYDISLR